jgi:hypothetical protein
MLVEGSRVVRNELSAGRLAVVKALHRTASGDIVRLG